MSRPSSLKARHLASRGKWVLNVPAELSDTGKRRQLFYDTEKAAEADIETFKTRRDNFGTSLNDLTPARISEAAEAWKLLEPHRITLLYAVRSFLLGHEQRTASVTLSEAFDRFRESKQNKSPKYLQEIRQAKTTFETLNAQMVCDIRPIDLESILARLPNGSRNAKMRRLRSVFNFAIKRGWLVDGNNPISKLDFAENGKSEVQIFTVDQVQKLLNHALENDLEFLPYRVLTFFCGIRPEGEMERLEWSDIDTQQKLVTLRAEITKTKRKRFVDLSPNALAWLKDYQKRGGSITGLVAPWSPQIRRAKHRVSYKDAAIKKWIQQGARHSYCSYWLALHKDVNKLVLQSGHTDADTMWTNYHAGVTEKEANRFWAIKPDRSNA
jgi:integrase